MAKYSLIEKKMEGELSVYTLKIDKEIFQKRKDKVFNRLAKEINITGFRPGKAPKAMVEARLGADLFEKTLNELLPEVAVEFFKEENIDFLGRIDYKVLKVSDAEGVEFSVSFIKYPEFKLPDFKKIKVDKEKVELSEEEIEEEMQNIFKYQESESEDKKDIAPKKQEKAKITDKKVESLGVGLKTVEELKNIVRKQLESRKENLVRSKQLEKVVAEAVEKAKITTPQTLVDQEVHRKEHEYVHRIEDLGLKLEDFLKTQKTSLEDLKKEWTAQAEKQIKSDLLLFEIAKVNELKVTNEEINAELGAITDEKLKKQYDSIEGRNYISSVILQQKSLAWIMKEAGILPEPVTDQK
jgi:FKBP-type peptidyl-prolyl cis-trans isomerase (trigger factor)